MIKHISKRARSSTTNYSMSNVSEWFPWRLLSVFPSSKAVAFSFPLNFYVIVAATETTSLGGSSKRSGSLVVSSSDPKSVFA